LSERVRLCSKKCFGAVERDYLGFEMKQDKKTLFERVVGEGFHGDGLVERETGDVYSSRDTVERALAIKYEGEMIVSGCWIFAITTQGYHLGMPQIYTAVERMKKVGLTYVELEGIGTDGVNMVYENRDELKKRLDDLGLQVVNFATILSDFRHPEPDRRRLAVELFRTKGLETASLFGCRTIQTDTFHPWVRIYGKPPYTDDVEYEGAQTGYKYVTPDEYDERREFDAVVETFTACVEAAERAGLSFCIEPRKGEIVDTVGYMLRVIDHVPGLGVVLDTAHLNFGEDVILAAARLKEHIVYCHFADNDGTNNDHLEIRDPRLGNRGVDFLGVLTILKSAGYSGFLALDTGKVDDIDQAVMNSKLRLEEMLALLEIPYRS
jgi:sugar phosphate isomerase/epimerase